jgi:hypothetical protein
MTNPFATSELIKSLSNYPVAKGDVEGHPFHGNQFISAIEGHANSSLLLSRKSAGIASDGRGNVPFPTRAEHRDLADQHRTLSRALEGLSQKAGANGDQRTASFLHSAAVLHNMAATEHDGTKGGVKGDARSYSAAAMLETHNALDSAKGTLSANVKPVTESGWATDGRIGITVPANAPTAQ